MGSFSRERSGEFVAPLLVAAVERAEERILAGFRKTAAE
jgi:hypothetical protein